MYNETKDHSAALSISLFITVYYYPNLPFFLMFLILFTV